jgi:DNA repair protein RadC
MSYLIKEMPNNERPRERLLNYGVKSLSTSELLAIILQTGNKGESVLDLSKRILYKIEKLSLLLNMNVQELMKIKGVGVAKGCIIVVFMM